MIHSVRFVAKKILVLMSDLLSLKRKKIKLLCQFQKHEIQQLGHLDF